MNMGRLTKIAMIAGALAMCLGAQAQYAKNNVRFLSRVSLSAFSGSPSSGSGCAGYISPSGKEYAIIGLRNGNAVVNITNPITPVIVGHIPGVNSQWHEVCVLGDFAYATTEGGGGIQIIDLREVDQGIVSLAATYTGRGVSSGHTIQAIPESKLIIINGGNMEAIPGNPNPQRGLRALDCSDPVNPVEVGTWITKYVHDAIYVKRTTGPHAGKMICYAFCANGATGGLYIIDVTTTPNAQGHNVPKMETLGFINYYANLTDLSKFYSHSGSLSPDGKYIYANDELDEMNGTSPDLSTHIINVENLNAPTYAGRFINPINAIDHNSMTQDGFLFLSAYKSGLRVYDMSVSGTLTESGFFDTYPEGSGFQFSGAWGTWSGFPSGNVIISDINRGLFVVDPSEAKGWGAPITNVAYTGFTGPTDGVGKLRRSDDNTIYLPADIGRPSITTSFATDSQAKGKVDVAIKAKVRNIFSAKLGISIKNHVTGAWDVIDSILAEPTYQTVILPNLEGSKYVSSTNTIEVRVQAFVSKRGPMQLDLDMVQVKVHN